jgi:hypothetical protein
VDAKSLTQDGHQAIQRIKLHSCARLGQFEPADAGAVCRYSCGSAKEIWARFGWVHPSTDASSGLGHIPRC